MKLGNRTGRDDEGSEYDRGADETGLRRELADGHIQCLLAHLRRCPLSTHFQRTRSQDWELDRDGLSPWLRHFPDHRGSAGVPAHFILLGSHPRDRLLLQPISLLQDQWHTQHYR